MPTPRRQGANQGRDQTGRPKHCVYSWSRRRVRSPFRAWRASIEQGVRAVWRRCRIDAGRRRWVSNDLVGDEADSMRVALVAGATRGAGRAIAVELARAGLFVYATGRSSRTSGSSELNRPETIEETGELMGAAGGSGAVRVVDHEDPDAVAEMVATIGREHGRLDVLVNDI